MTDTGKPDSLPLGDTDIESMDEILRGRLTPNRLYLVVCDRGSGKTIITLRYLFAGGPQG